MKPPKYTRSRYHDEAKASLVPARSKHAKTFTGGRIDLRKCDYTSLTISVLGSQMFLNECLDIKLSHVRYYNTRVLL